jgi:hypothetical protein
MGATYSPSTNWQSWHGVKQNNRERNNGN